MSVHTCCGEGGGDVLRLGQMRSNTRLHFTPKHGTPEIKPTSQHADNHDVSVVSASIQEHTLIPTRTLTRLQNSRDMVLVKDRFLCGR